MEIAIEIVVAVAVIIALIILNARTVSNSNKIFNIKRKMLDTDDVENIVFRKSLSEQSRVNSAIDSLSKRITSNSDSIKKIKDEKYKQDYPNIESLNAIKSIRSELGGVDYVKSVREVLANMSDDEINELIKKI